MSLDYVIVIPARYESIRLPGKPLVDIEGKPLIQRVYDAAIRSTAKEVIIATDSQIIMDITKGFNAKTIMTDSNHQSGTDRINEIANYENWVDDQVIVNLQGDNPLMPHENIDQLANMIVETSGLCIATLATLILEEKDIEDPNVVKVDFICETKKAISFKRTVHSENKLQKFWRHIGIYAYTANSLKVFSNGEPSKTEIKYKLEQLRAFDLGINIIVDEADTIPGPDVDTQYDLETVRRIFRSF
ncbi:3-deoxy-manno-octulosonate cytidylyltransferase [Gammaproteobacteria bacterium]|jgi:3-deoxy-manno-octulosonate cytidylyltransferase (CMP-KDO synthetase)|nr:3-deoxy-manno-octulosonate cytidylyltransferase [Gammaproteobacteria bacterium]|tara:strand:- start:558 stop:1292 length:735 start_codon:yes stop_codon:yes gene_type:complete